MKYYIRTYGCQMNIRDSEAVSAILSKNGYLETKNIDESDIIILNTCSVRDSAERKVEGYLWKLREWKEAEKDRILCLIGCMAQSEGEKLLRKFPHLDIVAGISSVSKLPEMISNVAFGYGRFSDTSLNQVPYDDAQTHISDGNVSAFVSIMRGCSMRCSYCIVPQVRGKEQSRPKQEIIEEIKILAENGIKEIFLLGQNIAAYGFEENKEKKENPHFADLLSQIAKIEKIKRIRFTSPHPANFNDSLINAICEIRKICECIHLPLQSGSDRILSAMGRKYTSADYMKIIEKLKSRRYELSFSTDVIVGFPGETDEDFNCTRKILNDVAFDQEFIFKYSKRKNTPAAEMPNQIPVKIKEERNQILLEDLKKRVLSKNKSLLGSKIEILIDSSSSKGDIKRLIGKSSSNKTIVAEKKEGYEIGNFATVLVDDFTLAALYGKILS